MSNFLTSQDHEISIETAKFIAKAQTHMIETIKMNFQSSHTPNLQCNSCNISECNQSHLLYCTKLIEINEIVTYTPEYEDIFNDSDPKDQLHIANIMIENWKKKKKVEEDITI